MCRRLSAEAVLSYTLRGRRTVTSKMLRDMRQSLISKMSDVLADVSFVSMRKVARLYGDSLEIRTTGSDFTISKKTGKHIGCGLQHVDLFDDRYLDACLSPYFSPKEKKGIQCVLQNK